jgi:hypothetical protein
MRAKVAAVVLAIAATAGAAPRRTISVPPAAGLAASPLRVECPLNQPTRIVLSTPLRRLVVKPQSAVDEMGVTVQAARPAGILEVNPTRYPASGEIHIQLADRPLVIVVRATNEGAASEIVLTFESPQPAPAAAPPVPRATVPPQPRPTVRPLPPPASVAPQPTLPRPTVEPSKTPSPLTPTPVPIPSVAPTPSPSAVSTPTPAPVPTLPPVASPSPSPSLALEGLLSAKPIVIGRQEGLPGQKRMLLDDALRGETHVWFRFTLKGGAKERVARISTGSARAPTFAEKASGNDLKIVVQLPIDQVRKNTSMTIELAGGSRYRFESLTTPTLTNLLKRF